MNLEQDLKSLIKPSAYHRREGITHDDHMKQVDAWRDNMVPSFLKAFKAIETSDADEKPIPRRHVLTLAVTYNQIYRNDYTFMEWITGNRDLLDKARKHCEQFKVKGIMKASSSSWYVQKSKLELKIETAVLRRGSTHCRRCGRLLTVDLSVRRGIGPKCWRKMGGVGA